MPLIQSRVPFTPQNPYRTKRPSTSKIIFLSCEGSVTEEEYFKCISDIFSVVKSKIQFISVAEDAVQTKPKFRTPDQEILLSKVRPKHLVERIEAFIQDKNEIYQFSEYPDDEFWIVTDVDKNWSDEIIDSQNAKTYKDEWNEAIETCQEKGYFYAVSNPFFEIWLLLHHDCPDEEDKKYAVTDDHEYEPTSHFRERLACLNAQLKNQKHINFSDYTEEKIKLAIQRAEQLHICKEDLCPKYFATTVYLLLQKIIELLPEYDSVRITI